MKLILQVWHLSGIASIQIILLFLTPEIGAYIEFKVKKEVLFKAIFHNFEESAKFAAEIPHWDFDRVHKNYLPYGKTGNHPGQV